MQDDPREEELLRSVALENARSILAARRRAEEELLAAKEALRESEQRFRAIFERAAVGIAISDLDGRLAEVNAKFVEILGYPAQELAGMTAYQISHPDDVASTRAHVARLLAGEISDYSYEKRYVRKDGRVVWTLTSVGLLQRPAGPPAPVRRRDRGHHRAASRRRTASAPRAPRPSAWASSRTSSSPRCRTSCARRSARSSAGRRSSPPAAWSARSCCGRCR